MLPLLFLAACTTTLTIQISASIRFAQDEMTHNRFDSALDVLDEALVTLQADVTLSSEAKLPLLAQVYIQRGQVHMLLYQWDNALMDYNMAIDLLPTAADGYYYRGVLYYTVVVDRERALPDFEQYLAFASDGEHAADATQYAADIRAQLEALKP